MSSRRERLVGSGFSRTSIAVGLAAAVLVGVVGSIDDATSLAAQQPPAGAARASAPVDLTGYWVSIVTEDWRYRMVMPAKGDYASVPLNPAGRRAADAWDPAKDAAGGDACKAYGAASIMRMPGRLHVTWSDDNALKIETDAGTQTRLLHFGEGDAPAGPNEWQGYSMARWQPTAGRQAGQGTPRDQTGANLGLGRGTDAPSAAVAGGTQPPAGGRGAAPATPQQRGGSLKVVTTRMRAGYLRKNGVPYSEKAVLTEYFTRVPGPQGAAWLVVTTIIDDPQYLTTPFITSTHFRREADGTKWRPTPCGS
jgi:hypothetical protein